MSRSFDTTNTGEFCREYYRGNRKSRLKAKRQRKQFAFRGDGWATKARGGPGYKGPYGHFNGMSASYPKHLFKKKKSGEEALDKELREFNDFGLES